MTRKDVPMGTLTLESVAQKFLEADSELEGLTVEDLLCDEVIRPIIEQEFKMMKADLILKAREKLLGKKVEVVEQKTEPEMAPVETPKPALPPEAPKPTATEKPKGPKFRHPTDEEIVKVSDPAMVPAEFLTRNDAPLILMAFRWLLCQALYALDQEYNWKDGEGGDRPEALRDKREVIKSILRRVVKILQGLFGISKARYNEFEADDVAMEVTVVLIKDHMTGWGEIFGNMPKFITRHQALERSRPAWVPNGLLVVDPPSLLPGVLRALQLFLHIAGEQQRKQEVGKWIVGPCFGGDYHDLNFYFATEEERELCAWILLDTSDDPSSAELVELFSQKKVHLFRVDEDRRSGGDFTPRPTRPIPPPNGVFGRGDHSFLPKITQKGQTPVTPAKNRPREESLRDKIVELRGSTRPRRRPWPRTSPRGSPTTSFPACIRRGILLRTSA
ncbi:MAG: hypothetical protein V1848_03385 [Candidatus Magasanikbacteria bacterium]